jgi:hypothetical protein
MPRTISNFETIQAAHRLQFAGLDLHPPDLIAAQVRYEEFSLVTDDLMCVGRLLSTVGDRLVSRVEGISWRGAGECAVRSQRN